MQIQITIWRWFCLKKNLICPNSDNIDRNFCATRQHLHHYRVQSWRWSVDSKPSEEQQLKRITARIATQNPVGTVTPCVVLPLPWNAIDNLEWQKVCDFQEIQTCRNLSENENSFTNNKVQMNFLSVSSESFPQWWKERDKKRGLSCAKLNPQNTTVKAC